MSKVRTNKPPTPAERREQEFRQLLGFVDAGYAKALFASETGPADQRAEARGRMQAYSAVHHRIKGMLGFTARKENRDAQTETV